jgi:GMP synthase (glutamine-hydrolysing)
VCFGFQLLVSYFGGTVEKGVSGEFGKTVMCDNYLDLPSKPDSVLLRNVTLPHIVWMSHMDVATKLTDNFVNYTSTQTTKYVLIEDKVNNVFAVQYHPEVTDTKYGKRLYRNFVR